MMQHRQKIHSYFGFQHYGIDKPLSMSTNWTVCINQQQIHIGVGNIYLG